MFVSMKVKRSIEKWERYGKKRRKENREKESLCVYHGTVSLYSNLAGITFTQGVEEKEKNVCLFFFISERV